MTQEPKIFPYIAKLLNDEKVQYKTLGEVAELKRGTSITKKTSNQGEIPVISGGQQPAYYIDQFNRKGNTITVAGSGAYAGHVMYWEEPIFVGDAFSVKTDETILSTKYVYHFLLQNQQKIYAMKKGSGVLHVYPKDLSVLQIPLPPLSVQQEIVRILDKFTQLEAELEAELDCRKRQYEYYRNALLSFGDLENRGGYNSLINSKIQYKTLGEVGTFIRGNGLQKKDLIESGVPAIHYGQIYTHYGVSTEQTISFVSSETAEKLKKVDYGDVIITNTSENLEDVGKAVAYYVKEQGVTGGHATIFKPSEKIIGKYLVYYTQTIEFSNQKRKYAKGTKVIDVSANDLAKISIPLPPIEEQERIVAILDKFDTLVNSISEGLPKEIQQRRQQYEYYREQLLTF